MNLDTEVTKVIVMNREVALHPEWHWLTLKANELRVVVHCKAWAHVQDLMPRIAEIYYPKTPFVADYDSGKWGLNGKLAILGEGEDYITFSCALDGDADYAAASSVLLLLDNVNSIALHGFGHSKIKANRHQLAEIGGGYSNGYQVGACLFPTFVKAICNSDLQVLNSELYEVIRTTYRLLHGKEHTLALAVYLGPDQFRWQVDSDCRCFGSTALSDDRMITGGCQLSSHNIDSSSHLLMVLAALAHLFDVARSKTALP